MLVPGTCLLLLVLVALDGPFPVVPSEPLLMTAVGVAAGDPPAVAALLAAALAGSLVGDALMFAAGRSSRRVRAETRLSRWVAVRIAARPGSTLLGARFLPGGRLVSTAAAGRYGVPLRTFLPWSAVSSTAWVTWDARAGSGPRAGRRGGPVAGAARRLRHRRHHGGDRRGRRPGPVRPPSRRGDVRRRREPDDRGAERHPRRTNGTSVRRVRTNVPFVRDRAGGARQTSGRSVGSMGRGRTLRPVR